MQQLPEYRVGDYVDYFWVNWTPKIIIEITPQAIAKLREPRLSTHASPADTIELSNSHIKPFRTETKLRSYAHAYYTRGRRLNEQLATKRLAELRDFDFSLAGQTPRDIIQLVRGRHYFFLEEITNSQYESKEQLTPALLYLRAHLLFFLRYLQHTDFQRYSPHPYASPMAALCSAYGELLEGTLVALGLSQDGETFRKENSEWMEVDKLKQEQRQWVENELLPTLSQLTGETLPAVFIFALFNFLLVLLRKGRTEESEPLSALYNDLYAHLLLAMRTAPADLKEVDTFSREADALFALMHRAHPDALPHESPSTQRLDEEEEGKGEVVTLTKQRFVKRQKLEFKLVASEYYYRCGKMENFIREMNQCGAEIGRELDALSPKEATDPARWSPVVAPFLLALQQRNLLEKILDPVISASELIGLSRQVIIKFFRAIPRQCLLAILQRRRFSMVKIVLPSKTMRDEELALWLSEQMESLRAEKKDAKENFECLSFFIQWTKSNFGTHEHIVLSVQKRIIGKQLELIGLLNEPEHAPSIESFLNVSDPFRENILREYTLNTVLPNLQAVSTLFSELLLLRYLRANSVSLQLFTQLCQFMLDPHFDLSRYEKRKEAVLSVLHRQFEDTATYQNYLGAFLESYCKEGRTHHSWAGASVLPQRDCHREFLAIKFSKDFCRESLQKLAEVYHELDMTLFELFLIKYNFLAGNFLLGPDEDVEVVMKVPEFFDKLVASLILWSYFPSGHKKHKILLLERIINSLFRVAEVKCYSEMLVTFFKGLLSSNDCPLEPIRIFTELRKKAAKMHQLQGEVKGDRSGKLTATVYNVTAEDRLKQTVTLQHNEFMRVLFCQERKNCVYQLYGLAEHDTFDVVRHKTANKCNREPEQFVLLFHDKYLSDEQLRLPLIPTIQQSYPIDEELGSPPPLIFQVVQNPKRSLLEAYLLDNLVQIFSSNIHKLLLLNGMQLPAMDWKSSRGLEKLSDRFLGYLQNNNFPQSLQRDLFVQDVMLDFYIWKVDDYKGLRFDFLLPYLREVSSKDELLRNFKILYLIHQSSSLDPKICEELLLLLIPAEADESRREEIDFDVMDELFQWYCHLIFKIIEQTHPNLLQFLFTLKSIKKFQQHPSINNQIKQFWKRIYNQTSIQFKTQFFSNIEQRMLRYPECMYHFQFIIGQSLHLKERSFYDHLLHRMTKQLIGLNKSSNSISEGQAIKALISNMETLLEVGAQAEIVFSQQLLEFLMAKIYECSSNTLHQLLEVLNHTLERKQNRKSLLQFFMKEIDERDWQVKGILIKPKKKYDALQMQDLVGLKNPHSICYINSFLQQLYNIELFRDQLLGSGWKLNPIPEEDLILQLKKIFVNLHEQREPYINYDFFKAFKNMDGQETATDVQMDVDEFRNMLFDRIESLLPKEYNFLPKIFNGKLASVIKSLECEHQSTRQEDFSSLCIEVKGFSNLEASLKNYLKPEILQNQNAYHCDDCKKKVKAQKYIELKSFPPYLTFVLKRFEYVSYRRLKINSSFQFPLQTFEYFPGVKYTLKGIIVHIGVSQAGHYISFIKRNNIWFEFNDSYVSEVSEQYVLNFSYGNTKDDSYSYMSTKNAYLIIYEADNVPKPQIPDQNRPFFGIQNEIKNIKKTKALQDKQKVYFDTQFLKYATSIVQNYPYEQSLRLLFNLLITISFKTIKIDGLKEEDILNALKALKRFSDQMSFLWQEKQLEKIMQTIQLNLSADFKAIICDLLVSSCSAFDAVAQNFLEDCLQRLHTESKDVSFYYGLMHRMALKFGRVCSFLNERRIVGRILDLTYEGLIGEKIRLDLKKTTLVPFESQARTRINKDIIKNDMRYRKWSLLNLVLQKCEMNVHEIEKQYYLYQTNSMYFKSIFDEFINKACLNEGSRYFRYLAESNFEYSNKLINHISESLSRQKPEQLRKYLRVLKELLLIQDQNTNERIRMSIIIFQKLLKKYSEDRMETSCDYIWQWMIKIGKKNRLFREQLRKNRSLFEHVLKFKVLGPKYLSYQDSFKPDKTKNRSYGLIFANVYQDIEMVHNQKIEQTRKLLFDEELIEQEPNWDSDEDIVKEEITIQNNIFMRYCDETNLIEYRKVRVTLAIGQTIFFRYERFPETLNSSERSNERWFRLNEQYIGSEYLSESPLEI